MYLENVLMHEKNMIGRPQNIAIHRNRKIIKIFILRRKSRSNCFQPIIINLLYLSLCTFPDKPQLLISLVRLFPLSTKHNQKNKLRPNQVVSEFWSASVHCIYDVKIVSTQTNLSYILYFIHTNITMPNKRIIYCWQFYFRI